MKLRDLILIPAGIALLSGCGTFPGEEPKREDFNTNRVEYYDLLTQQHAIAEDLDSDGKVDIIYREEVFALGNSSYPTFFVAKGYEHQAPKLVSCSEKTPKLTPQQRDLYSNYLQMRNENSFKIAHASWEERQALKEIAIQNEYALRKNQELKIKSKKNRR